MKKAITLLLILLSMVMMTSCSEETIIFIQKLFYFDEVMYSMNYDGKSYMVSGVGLYHDGEIEIASTYEGLPVTRIDSLESDRPIKKVIVPESINSITLGTKLDVEYYEVSESNNNYKSIDGNIYSKDGTHFVRYASGRKDESFTVPTHVTSVDDGAFAYSGNLKYVDISDNVKWIGNFVFRESLNLNRIKIGSAVEGIAVNVFEKCTALTNIEVDLYNQHYMSMDGNLYTKDQTRFIQYAIGKSDVEFTIPEGVKYIGINAFSYSANLQYINIPDTVIEIDLSFRKATGLKKNVIPDSVIKLHDQSFRECSSLESVVLGDGITNVGERQFQDCVSLASVTLSQNITTIEEGAFENCISLKEINLPEKLQVIEGAAFANCTSLESIKIPSTVEFMSNSAFYSCLSLKYFEVDVNNVNYKSLNGNLYTKDGKTLIQYAVGKDEASFEVPSGVVTICSGAFYGNDSLVSIKIPNTVTEIGHGAFGCCTALKSISIPNTVQGFGIDEMLGGCSSLERIDFSGTVNEWHSMQYGYCGIHVQKTTGFKIYCTDGVIKE